MSSDTPETDALVPQFLNGGKVPDMFAHCRKLEQERDEARESLMRIEEVFIDSDDTYEDLIKMGSIARAALEESK